MKDSLGNLHALNSNDGNAQQSLLLSMKNPQQITTISAMHTMYGVFVKHLGFGDTLTIGQTIKLLKPAFHFLSNFECFVLQYYI